MTDVSCYDLKNAEVSPRVSWVLGEECAEAFRTCGVGSGKTNLAALDELSKTARHEEVRVDVRRSAQPLRYPSCNESGDADR